MNLSAGGGRFSLFDELDAFDFSFVWNGSSCVLDSFSLEPSSTVGDSTLRDFAVESSAVDSGLDFDLCFLTCNSSLFPKAKLVLIFAAALLTPVQTLS